MSVTHLLTLIALFLVSTFGAAFIVERSVSGALKGLKLALKSEFTTDVGRLNLVAMILIVFLILVFNIHEMLYEALRVEGVSRTENSVIAPTTLVGLFFIGSLICVMLIERRK